jgi:hypothetical protein
MLSITVMMAYFGNTTRRNQSDMPLRYLIFTVEPNPVNNGKYAAEWLYSTFTREIGIGNVAKLTIIALELTEIICN